MAHKPLESVKRLECHFFLHQNRRVVVNSFERMSVLPVVSRSRSIVHVPHSAPKGASIPLYFGALAVPWPKKSCKVFCKASCHIAASWPLLAIVSGGSWSEFFDQGKSHSALASLQICRCHSGHRFAACWQTTHDQSMPFLFEETCQPDRGRRPQDT